MILKLLDRDTYVEGISMNYTGEWIEEVVQTHNAFKARDFSQEELDEYGTDILEYVKGQEGAILEIVTLL